MQNVKYRPIVILAHSCQMNEVSFYTLSCKVQRETEKALLLDFNEFNAVRKNAWTDDDTRMYGVTVWVPKSVCTVNNGEVSIDKWFVEKSMPLGDIVWGDSTKLRHIIAMHTKEIVENGKYKK